LLSLGRADVRCDGGERDREDRCDRFDERDCWSDDFGATSTLPDLSSVCCPCGAFSCGDGLRSTLIMVGTSELLSDDVGDRIGDAAGDSGDDVDGDMRRRDDGMRGWDRDFGLPSGTKYDCGTGFFFDAGGKRFADDDVGLTTYFLFASASNPAMGVGMTGIFACESRVSASLTCSCVGMRAAAVRARSRYICSCISRLNLQAIDGTSAVEVGK